MGFDGPITTTPTVAMEQKEANLAVREKNYDTIIATLTPEQRQEYLAKADSISTNDVNSVRNFGQEISSIVAKNGDVLLSQVKANRSNEVVEYVNSLLVELGDFDDEINKFSNSESSALKRFIYKLPIIRNLRKTVQEICVQYSTVSENVNKISDKIAMSKVVALRDNTTLQQIYENNELYLQDLAKLIVAGKLKLEEIDKQIEDMKTSGAESYELQNMQYFRNALSKRISDMQVTGHVFYQSQFQIMAIQQNNNSIADKSDEIVNHVIPIWKNQLPMAIVLKNQTASIEAQNKIAETTNRLLEKTANDLKTNSISVAKASEESVISLSTLDKTTKALIDTVKSVRQIHADAEKNRGIVESTLQKYNQEIEGVIIEGK